MFSTKLMTNTILLKRSCTEKEVCITQGARPTNQYQTFIKKKKKIVLGKKKVSGISFQNTAYSKVSQSENNTITQNLQYRKQNSTHIYIYL